MLHQQRNYANYVDSGAVGFDFYDKDIAALAVANRRRMGTIATMSTVAEIESALEKLPVEAQREVAAWLQSKLWPETPAMLAAVEEAERSLVEEGGIPVEDVRRNLRRWLTG